MGRYASGFAVGSALAVGAATLALLAGTTGLGWPADDVLALRAARLAASALVGASLAVVGTAFQPFARPAHVVDVRRDSRFDRIGQAGRRGTQRLFSLRPRGP